MSASNNQGYWSEDVDYGDEEGFNSQGLPSYQNEQAYIPEQPFVEIQNLLGEKVLPVIEKYETEVLPALKALQDGQAQLRKRQEDFMKKQEGKELFAVPLLLKNSKRKIFAEASQAIQRKIPSNSSSREVVLWFLLSGIDSQIPFPGPAQLRKTVPVN